MRPEAHLVAAAIRNRELTVCGADMLYGELESQLVPQPAGGDELYGKRHHWNRGLPRSMEFYEAHANLIGKPVLDRRMHHLDAMRIKHHPRRVAVPEPGRLLFQFMRLC